MFQTKYQIRNLNIIIKKSLNILQINTIWVDSMHHNYECGQLVVKNISNDGTLVLKECKITKPEYEAFSVGLGDKHVIKL